MCDVVVGGEGRFFVWGFVFFFELRVQTQTVDVRLASKKAVIHDYRYDTHRYRNQANEVKVKEICSLKSTGTIRIWPNNCCSLFFLLECKGRSYDTILRNNKQQQLAASQFQAPCNGITKHSNSSAIAVLHTQAALQAASPPLSSAGGDAQ